MITQKFKELIANLNYLMIINNLIKVKKVNQSLWVI